MILDERVKNGTEFELELLREVKESFKANEHADMTDEIYLDTFDNKNKLQNYSKILKERLREVYKRYGYTFYVSRSDINKVKNGYECSKDEKFKSDVYMVTTLSFNIEVSSNIKNNIHKVFNNMICFNIEFDPINRSILYEIDSDLSK